MNLVSLIVHGLSAISVYSETIGVRLLLFSGSAATVFVALLLVTIGVRLFTEAAIPGWASYVTAILLVLIINSLMLASFFSFFVLYGRSHYAFIPFRDCPVFIRAVNRICSIDIPAEQTRRAAAVGALRE
jgi:hypothetical protein